MTPRRLVVLRALAVAWLALALAAMVGDWPSSLRWWLSLSVLCPFLLWVGWVLRREWEQ